MSKQTASRQSGSTLREELIRAGMIKPPEPKPAVKPVKEGDKNYGIKTTHWFWAAMNSMSSKAPAVPATPDPAAATTVNADQEVMDLLTQNPGINGSTLLNLLKAKGFKLSKEADAASAATQTLRAQESVRSTPARSGLRILTRLTESSMRDDGIGPTKFRVVLLQEGLGNLGDAHYYTRAALQSAVTVFEGKKIYADHPSSTDEETRPERSVRDILGHFENVCLEEVEGQPANLCGDVVIMPDKPYEFARALMRHSVEYAKKYPDKEFVGLSINANGESSLAPIAEALKQAPEAAQGKLKKALEAGIESVRIVTTIHEAVSCDLVTEAGAGGKILSLIEHDKENEKMSKKAIKESTSETEAMTSADPSKDEGADTKQEGEEKEGTTGDDHADAQQDAELIKQMLDEYLGKDQHGEEEMKQAHEAMKCAMEAGEDKEGAMKCAGHAMKMARYMAAKKEASPKEEAKEESKESKEESTESVEATKESAAMIKLRGENAALRETVAKRELSDYLDSKLRESGLKMEVTKKFRDAVKAAKNKAEIDEKFNLFLEGYKMSSGAGEGDLDLSDLAVQNEKQGEVSTGETALDLSSCTNE